jgi:hypothetical protein
MTEMKTDDEEEEGEREEEENGNHACNTFAKLHEVGKSNKYAY